MHASSTGLAGSLLRVRRKLPLLDRGHLSSQRVRGRSGAPELHVPFLFLLGRSEVLCVRRAVPACACYSALVMEDRASSMLDKRSSRVLHPDPEHPLKLAAGLLASEQ